MTVVIRRKTLYRTTDPDTSRDGVPAAVSRQAFCDRLLAEYERASLTSEEAANAAGLDPWQASKRTSDLSRQGLIEWTGEKRPGASGRMQRVHRAVR